jgi:amidase
VSQAQDSAIAAAGIAGMSAIDIAARVRDGRLSAVDVVAAHLERIKAVDPRLNAFQAVLEASAMEEARALSGRSDLAELPLAGVPVAIKDNTDIAGQPTRHGSAATSSLPALSDDEIVRRFRQAGAVIIGKTRLTELAIWPFTESDAFGLTRNPWDPSLTCGGSSGGSAVAVATGMAALASASDGGGSIRIPAAACGVFGLKPAPEIVPIPGGRDEHWFGLSAFGPIARTPADAGLALDVMAATTRYRDPKPPAARLQIAVSARHPAAGFRVSAEVRSALTATAGALRQAGHEIQQADPPYPPTPQQFMRCWLGGIAEEARGLPEFELEPRTRALAAAGRKLLVRGLVKPRLVRRPRLAAYSRSRRPPATRRQMEGQGLGSHPLRGCPMDSLRPVVESRRLPGLLSTRRARWGRAAAGHPTGRAAGRRIAPALGGGAA